MTHALARQTRVGGRTAEEYRDPFLSRFEALATSLELTSKGKSAALPDLARAVMEPFRDGPALLRKAAAGRTSPFPAGIRQRAG